MACKNKDTRETETLCDLEKSRYATVLQMNNVLEEVGHGV